jgi:WD40 repeat protein
MKKFFVLFAFLFSALAVQSQYPVIGDWSDIVWMRGSNAPHYTVVFDPNSQYVAGMNDRGNIEIFSIEDNGRTIKIYNGRVPYFLKEGKLLAYIASVGYHEVRIVDFETDSIVFKKSATQALWMGAPSFTISPDERIVAIGGEDRIDLYDIQTGQLLRSKTNITMHFPPYSIADAGVTAMLFLPDGKQIFFDAAAWYGDPRSGFTQETRLLIWNLETDSITISRYGWQFPAKLTPDGTKMVYAGGGPGRLATVIDLKTNEEVGYVPIPPPPMDTIMNCVRDLSISPDGKYVLYAICEWPGKYFPYHIGIWDIELHRLVYVLPNDYGAGYSCAFSSNSKYFTSGGRYIFLFDFEKIKRKIEAVGVEENSQSLSATIVYPNPTHDVVQVRFTLDSPSSTTVKVLDLLGNTIRTIEDKLLEPGEHIYTIDLTNVASGEYYLQIKAGAKLFNGKIVVTH